MAAIHRTHDGAIDDLAELAAYLRREAPGQEQRLRALYTNADHRLRRRPLVNATLYEDYRRVVLLPFKFMIVYTTDGHSTDILAVFDARRNPDALQETLRGRTFE